MDLETIASSRVTTAAHLVRRLKWHGVTTVFGIPGVHNQGIYDALMDEPEIASVVTRHEQGAAFMADGYARASGHPGVCLFISGPGLSNAITALAEAYADSTPIVAIATTYMTSPSNVGRRLHDMRDQSLMLAGCVKDSIRLAGPCEVPSIMDEAFIRATSGRPGPVVVEIPLELLASVADIAPMVGQPPAKAPLPTVALARARRAVASGRRPVLVVGGGASGARESVLSLIDTLRAPVVSTTAGKGVVPDSHRLSIGANLRSAGVRRLIATADPLIMVGTEWSPTDIGEQEYILPAALVRVNLEDDPRFDSYIDVRAEARDALDALNEGLASRVDNEVQARVAQLKAMAEQEPKRWLPLISPFLEAMQSVLSDDAIIVNDMNTLSYGASERYRSQVPRSFLAPKGYGTLGFALPAALGARFAEPHRQVVAIIGDGGFLFTAEELLTAVRYRQNLPILVWNNESFGAIRHTRTAAYGRSADDDLVNPDFVAFGLACRGRAMRVFTPDDLGVVLRQALEYRGPTIIEIVSPEIQA